MKKIEQWYDNMNKGQKRFVYGFCLISFRAGEHQFREVFGVTEMKKAPIGD